MVSFNSVLFRYCTNRTVPTNNKKWKIWVKCQRDCTQKLRNLQECRGLHKAFNKGGIRMRKIILLLPEYDKKKCTCNWTANMNRFICPVAQLHYSVIINFIIFFYHCYWFFKVSLIVLLAHKCPGLEEYWALTNMKTPSHT